MAASTQQKLDYLLKKIGYTASKTGLAEDSSLSGTKKAPFAESIPSPLVTANTSIWTDSESIPGTPPGSDSSYVKVYLAGTSGHRMTVDSTVSGSRAFIAYSTYNNTSTAILGDWIDTQFGDSYIIKVYKGDPNSGGTLLSAAGSGSNDTWFFDYASGVLNFNGTVIPSGVTDTNIYIVGYRYIGAKGTATAGINTEGTSTFENIVVNGNAGIGSLNVTGVSTLGITSTTWLEAEQLNVSGISTLNDVSINAGVVTFTNVSSTPSDSLAGGHIYAYDDGLRIVGGSGALRFHAAGFPRWKIDTGGTFAPLSTDGYDIGSSIYPVSNLIVSGNAGIGSLNVTGVSTLGITSATWLEAEQLDVSGISTLANTVVGGATTQLLVTGDARVTGELKIGDGTIILNDTGISTFPKAVNIGPVSISTVTATTFPFDVNVGSAITFFGGTGIVSATSFTGIGSNITQVPYTTLTGVTTDIVGDTTPKLGGDLDGDSKSIYGVGVLTATTFDGNLATINLTGTITNAQLAGSIANDKLSNDSVSYGGVSLDLGGSDATPAFDLSDATNYPTSSLSGTITNAQLAGSIANDKLANDSVSYGGVSVDLGASDATPAFDLTDATNYPYTSLTGITTDIVGDTTPTLGGNLDGNSKSIYGVGILTATTLDISGDVDIDGDTELDQINVSAASTFGGLVDIDAGAQANTLKVEDLTNNRIVIAGTGGELEDTTKLTFDGSTLAIVGDATFSGNVTIGGTLTKEDVTNIDSVGLITAQSGVRITAGGLVIASGVATFTDAIDADGGLDVTGGSGLVASTAKISDLTSGRVVVAGTSGELEDASTFTFSGGTVSATNFSGNLTGTLQTAAQTNITSVGTLSAVTVSGDITANGNITGDSATIISGISTVGATTYYGSGAHLTGIVTATGITTEGTSTFENIVVDGNAGIGSLNVTGVSTFKNIVYLEENVSLRFGTNKQIDSTATSLDIQSYGINDINIQSNAGGGTDGDIILKGGTTESLKVNGSGDIIVGSGISVVGVSTFTGITSVTSTHSALYVPQLSSSGVVTATTFSGSGASLTSITNSNLSGSAGITNANLANSTVSYGGVSLALGASDATPAFDLTDATNYPYTSLTGVTTDILGDSSPQLGGDLDLNSKDITGSGNIDVTGALKVSGISTFVSAVGISSDLTLTNTDPGSAAGPEFKLYRNSASPADADYLGQIKFAGESDTGVERNYAKITGKILDASNTNEDGIIEFAHIKAGSQTITGRFRSDSLQLLNGTALSVAGDITANGNIAGDGSTNITGINDITATGDLTISSETPIINLTDTNHDSDYQIKNGNGDFNIKDVTNGVNRITIDSSGTVDIAQHMDVGAGLDVTGNITASGDINANGNIVGDSSTNISGINSVTATIFYGDGAGLSNTGISTTVLKSDPQQNLYAGTGAGANSDADTCYNIGIGYSAATELNEGDNNVILGCRAGSSVESGSMNVLIGMGAGKVVTSGCNVFLGRYAGACVTSGSRNIALGAPAGARGLALGASAGSYNTTIGDCSGINLTSGNKNTFLGHYAGVCNSTGCCNTAIGTKALGGAGYITGNDNVAVGNFAGCGLCAGSYNIFMGTESGKNITSGANNIALGQASMGTGTVSGDGNISIGGHSALNLADGNWHIFIGCCAGTSQTTAEHDVFIGYLAGGCNDDTGYNVAIGCRAGRDVDGSDNVFLGRGAGAYVSHSSSNASKNTFLGACAAYSSGVTDDGSCNIAIGYYARLPEPTGSNQLVIGIGNSVGWINGNANMNVGIGTTNPDIAVGAGNTAKLSVGIVSAYQLYGDGSNLSNVGFTPDDEGNLVAGTLAGTNKDADTLQNIFLGCKAGCCVNAGDQNVFIGCKSGQYTTSGSHNIGIGAETLGLNTPGNYNIAFGYLAGRAPSSTTNNVWIGKCVAAENAVTGIENIAIGCHAMCKASSGAENIAIGREAMGAANVTGSANIVMGSYAGLKFTSANNNVVLGNYAMRNGTDVSATNSVVIGTNAGRNLTSAQSNVLIGNSAGCTLSTTHGNTFLGHQAGCLATGASNVFIGKYTSCSQTAGDRNIVIGCRANLPVLDGSDQILLKAANTFFYGCCNGGCTLVGIGTTGPNDVVGVGVTSKLSVGIVSAYQLYGDGSNLSNVGFTPDAHGNLLAGTNAGTLLSGSSSCKNIFIGGDAGKESTTSSCTNIFIGEKAASLSDVTGDCNVFIGNYAGWRLTSGTRNVALGDFAGGRITTGNCNTAIGNGTIGSINSTGCFNTALGQEAGKGIKDGGGNTFVGYYASAKCYVCGNYNASFGKKAGQCLTEGNRNLFLGAYAASDAVISGDCNVAIGPGSSLPIKDGSNQLVIGAAGNTWIVGNANFNVGIGTTNPELAVGVGNTAKLSVGIVSAYQLYGDGSNLTGVGWSPDADQNLVAGGQSPGANLDGTNACFNNLIGAGAGHCITSGKGNVALGKWAAYYTKTGEYNSYFNYAGSNRESGNYNVAIGLYALKGSETAADNTGGCNIALGHNAGCRITSGTHNIALGQLALGTGTVTGTDNIAIGLYAGTDITSGKENVFLGKCAGCNTTTGCYNIAFGKLALGTGVVTGTNNIVLGCQAGNNLTSGLSNVIIGLNAAAAAEITGYNNIILGKNSLGCLTSGHSNFTGGYRAGKCLTTGDYNIFLGSDAGRGNGAAVTANKTIAIGYFAGLNLTSGGYNTFIGGYAGCGVTECNHHIMIGKYAGALNGAGIGNIFMGKDAGHGSGTATDNDGSYNVALGYEAGEALTDGDNNILIGQHAGDAVTTGSNHVAIGYNALSAEDTLSGSVAIGYEALKLQNGASGNTAIGCGAGAAVVTGAENVFLGWAAGGNMTGSNNSIIGSLAMSSASSGSSNVAIGQDAGRNNTGDNNVIIGATAGDASGAGEQNVFVGRNSGSAVTDGQKNTFLGMNSGNGITDGNGNVAIGHAVCLTNGNCQLAIGHATNNWITGDSSYNITVNDISASNFNSTSDIRLKTNIQPIGNPIGKVKQIEGVSFNWKKDNKPALGVIADQVEKILPELVHGDDPKTVNYNGLIGLLIETVKEQQNQIDELNDRISKLE